jgi:hypothetical protein
VCRVIRRLNKDNIRDEQVTSDGSLQCLYTKFLGRPAEKYALVAWTALSHSHASIERDGQP